MFQYKRIKLAFELAGGNVILKTKQDTSTTTSVSSKQTMVLQTEKKDDLSAQSDENSWKEEVYAKLKKSFAIFDFLNYLIYTFLLKK